MTHQGNRFALVTSFYKKGACRPWHSHTQVVIAHGLRVLWMSAILAVSTFSLVGGEANHQSPASLAELADLPVEQLALIPIETVSGASRYEQKVTQAPASVSIVTSDEIKKLGYRTLAEILQSLGGIYVTSDRNYTYLGIRGFGRPGDYNSRVLLLVDGHRMNENIYDSMYIGTEALLDVDLIERVEVIRGPSSSIYGDNAFFGVINVVSRRAAQINGVEASGEAGAFESYKGRFTYGHVFSNSIELVLSGSWYESEGHERLFYPEFNQPTNNNGVARNSDGDRYQSFFTSVKWNEFTFSSGLVNREKHVPTASFDTVFDSGKEKTTDLRAYADLKFERDFSENTRVMARLFYDAYWYEGRYPYYATNYALPGNPPRIVINLDDALGEWVGTEWQVTQKLFDRHVLIAGLDYRENIRQLQHTYYDQSGFPDIKIDRNGRNAGVYGQAELRLCTNLVLNAGLRYDYYDSFGGTFNPRAGLIWNALPETTFKLLYGEAFRAPNVFELYYEAPGANSANPHLQPETIRTYELVWQQYLPANFRFTASGYYYEIHDLISQAVDAFDQTFFANVDEVHARGLELELQHRSAWGLEARLSYAFQRAENSSTGQELSNSPRQLARFDLITPIFRDRLFADLEVIGSSGVRTQAGKETDGYAVVNLTLFSQRIAKGLEVSATVYNLFNTQYAYPVSQDLRQDSITQDGRGFRVKLTYRF
jgi:iron complex outermembrane receptor protein